MIRLQLAMAQMNPVMGDFSLNVKRMKEMIEQTRCQGIQWLIFPEMALCGYPPEDLLLKKDFLMANRNALLQLLPATHGMSVVLGFADQNDMGIYNAAAFIHDQTLVGVYHKGELPNYGVFDEKRYFIPGQKPFLIDCGGIRIALTICEDIWVEAGPVEETISHQPIDLVINLSASPFHAGKIQERRRVLEHWVQKTRTAIVYSNMAGGQDELVFDGGSMLMDATGIVVASANLFEETVLFAEITWEALKPKGNLGEIAPEITLAAPPVGLIPLTNWIQPLPELIEEIFLALVTGTRDYLHKNGFSKAVIGLSGGIDSALTAVIAVQALGQENVIGVTMPSEYTSAATLADAKLVAENLGIPIYIIPIQPIMQRYHESLGKIIIGTTAGIAFENIQARIRGNLLMTLSNQYGWLVLTTGNKSEMAVGYCTLYGDMAGGFAVIKDVPKTVVYELAEFINRSRKLELIPQSTIDRAPTAELRHDQTDQDSLPPYPVLDSIIKQYVEEDADPASIIAAGHSAAVVWDCVRRIDQSEYKRRQAPPGIKITPKAFGRDRRLPLTNRFFKNSQPRS